MQQSIKYLNKSWKTSINHIAIIDFYTIFNNKTHKKYLKLIYLIKGDSNFEEFFEYFRKNTNLFIPLKCYDAKGIGKIK